MTLKDELKTALKEAIKAQDATRKTAIRSAIAAIKLVEVDTQEELDSPTLFGILQKEVKSRQESIADAEKADRPDLIEAAKAEMAVLQEYLPPPLTPEELEALVKETIAEVGASSPADMGEVMKTIMPKVQGRAEGGQVNQLVRSQLQN